VSIREITGREEWRVREGSTKTAVELLQRLVEWPSGSAMQADELPAPDRDALLAGIYVNAYGNTVESTAECTECSNRYEIRFPLSDLKATVERNAATGESDSESESRGGTRRRMRDQERVGGGFADELRTM